MAKKKQPSVKTQLKTALLRIKELEEFIQKGKAHMDELRNTLGVSSYDSWTKILQSIGYLVEYKRRNEGAQDVFNGMLNNENSKLWYLLRAITGDPTLKNSHEEANHVNGRRLDNSPFDKPRY